MFNDKDNFEKLMTGLEGARNLLKDHMTDELKQHMTDEQKAEYQKALEMTDPDFIRMKAQGIINMSKNI